MDNNMWQLPAGAFDPVPDPATLAFNLVIVGVYIVSSAVSAALRPLPFIVSVSDVYIQYVFGVVLLLIFLFGIGMMRIGWMVADNATRYAAWGRVMMRAAHVVLVFAVAMRGAPSASKTPAGTTNKY